MRFPPAFRSYNLIYIQHSQCVCTQCFGCVNWGLLPTSSFIKANWQDMECYLLCILEVAFNRNFVIDKMPFLYCKWIGVMCQLELTLYAGFILKSHCQWIRIVIVRSEISKTHEISSNLFVIFWQKYFEKNQWFMKLWKSHSWMEINSGLIIQVRGIYLKILAYFFEREMVL